MPEKNLMRRKFLLYIRRVVGTRFCSFLLEENPHTTAVSEGLYCMNGALATAANEWCYQKPIASTGLQTAPAAAAAPAAPAPGSTALTETDAGTCLFAGN